MELFIPRDSGPVGVKLAEHEDLRSASEKLQATIVAYLRGDPVEPGTRRSLEEYGTYFVQLLRGHIDKEDNTLFMTADMHLDEIQRAKIMRIFHKIDPRSRP